jgi:CheY-like chemotaxis protein
MTKKILIVEDEIILQDVYKILLSSQGYEVFTANNGAEGIKQLKDTHPDMVLLDLFMPVMDGKDFLKNTDLTDFPNTKIVVYTNLSDSIVETEMLELGAHKFILKASMGPQDLIDLVGETTNS